MGASLYGARVCSTEQRSRLPAMASLVELLADRVWSSGSCQFAACALTHQPVSHFSFPYQPFSFSLYPVRNFKNIFFYTRKNLI
jgi:hypothetical protein